MAKIGGWWVKSHTANPDEEIIESYYVNYLREEKRPLGGKLFLTNQRLLFSPHFIDSLLGGTTEIIDLDDIVSVRKNPITDKADESKPIADSLHIETNGGDKSFFVENLDKVIDDIHRNLSEE